MSLILKICVFIISLAYSINGDGSAVHSHTAHKSQLAFLLGRDKAYVGRGADRHNFLNSERWNGERLNAVRSVLIHQMQGYRRAGFHRKNIRRVAGAADGYCLLAHCRSRG